MEDIITTLMTDRPIEQLPRRYFGYLKHIQKFEPEVIYDIGSSVGAYTKYFHLLYPDAKVIMFEANDVFVPRYNGEDYNIVCLSDEDNKEVKFYNNPKNKDNEEVCSYYKSIVVNDDFKIMTTQKLDSFVLYKGIRFPDVIKINCCGSELDIIKGGVNVVKQCKYLVVRLQNETFFECAPLAKEVGTFIMGLGFVLEEMLDNFGTHFIDYVFKNINV
jgi:FkbM family methyltransferase